MFDDIVNMIRRKRLVVAIICCILFMIYCLWFMKTFIMRIWLKMINWFNCCFFQNQHFSCKTIWIFSNSNAILFVASQLTLSRRKQYSCILIDFLLILSSVSFLSSFWFWIVLHSDKIRSRVFVEITCYCRSRHEIFFWSEHFVMFLLKSSFDQTIDHVVRILIFDDSQRK